MGDDVADGGRLNVGSRCEVVCDQAGSKGVVCCMGKKGRPTVHKSRHRSSSQIDRSGSCSCFCWVGPFFGRAWWRAAPVWVALCRPGALFAVSGETRVVSTAPWNKGRPLAMTSVRRSRWIPLQASNLLSYVQKSVAICTQNLNQGCLVVPWRRYLLKMLEHLTMVGIEDLILAQAHEIERQRTSAHCLEKFKFGSCGATVVVLVCP